MVWLLSSGVKNTVIGMIHNFNYCRLHRIHQHILSTRWFVGSFTQRSKNVHTSVIRNSFTNFDKLIDQGKKSILKLKTRDKVPKDYNLIYKASMELTLRVAYPTFFMCTVGLFGFVIYGKYYKKNSGVPKSLARDIKILYPEHELWFFSAGLLLMALAAYSIMFKYPFRIYKHSNRKEYIAIYLNPIPLMLKQVQFTSVTPTKFKNPFYFFMSDCHYVLDGNKKSFLMYQFFRVPKDLTDMYEESKNVS